MTTLAEWAGTNPLLALAGVVVIFGVIVAVITLARDKNGPGNWWEEED